MPDSLVVGTLRALLTLDQAQFESGLKKADASLKSFSRSTATLGRQATALGTTLTKAFTLPLAAIGGASAKAAIDFETSFAGIIKTVDAATDSFGNLTATGEMLRDGMRDLSREIPINVNELNRIGEAAGQLGIRAENILGFTEVMAKLGVTTNLAADEAATLLARFDNITTGGAQESFDALGNVIVRLGNSLATTEAEIVNMGLRLAGAGTQIGLTQTDILSLAGALTSLGLEAEAGGTAFSRVMIEMQNAVLDGGAALEIFRQVAGDTFEETFRQDAAQAIQDFVTGLARMAEEGQNINPILDDLGLGGIRVSDALRRAGNSANQVGEALAIGRDELSKMSALTVEAERRFETTREQLTLFWNRLRDIGITIGNELLPDLRRLNDFLKDDVIPFVEKLVKRFVELDDTTKIVGLAFTGLAFALGPVLVTVGQLAFGLSGLAKALTSTGIAAKGATFAINGVKLALGPLGVALAAGTVAWTTYRFAVEKLKEVTPERELDILEAKLQRQAEALSKAAQAGQVLDDRQVIAAQLTQKRIQQLRDETRAVEGLLPPQLELADITFTLSREAYPDLERTFTRTRGLTDEQREAFRKLLLMEQDLLLPTRAFTQSFADLGEALAFTTGHHFIPFAGSIEDTSAALTEISQNLIDLRPRLVGMDDSVADLTMGMTAWEAILDSIGVKLDTPAPPTFFQTLGASIRNFLRDDLGELIISAITGGGDIARAIGASLGQISFTQIAQRIAQPLTNALGSVIGGAIGSIIPGLGTLLGSTLGNFFSGLFSFGGPSEAELAGRELANDFMQGFTADISEAQLEEVFDLVSQGWAQDLAEFVVVLGDLYEQVGLSQEEANGAARRLWDAIREGPDAVAEVIAEIEALQGELEQTEQNAIQLEQALTDMADATAERQQILDQVLRDGVDAMQDFLDTGLATGVEVPAAFATMLEVGELLEDQFGNRLITSAINAGEALSSLNTLGVVSGRNFAQFGASIKASFNILVREGASGAAALEALRGPIATLIFLQDEYGFAVDAGTQRIIDQGRAHGITAEEGRTAADLQIEALDRVIEALELLIETLREDLPGAMDTATAAIAADADVINRTLDDIERNVPKDIEIGVGFNIQPLDLPSFRNVRVPSFQRGTQGAFIEAGRGMLAALHGREAVVPESGVSDLAQQIARAMPGGRDVSVTFAGPIQVSGTGDDAAQQFLDAVTRQLQGGGRSASRFFGALEQATT